MLETANVTATCRWRNQLAGRVSRYSHAPRIPGTSDYRTILNAVPFLGRRTYTMGAQWSPQMTRSKSADKSIGYDSKFNE